MKTTGLSSWACHGQRSLEGSMPRSFTEQPSRLEALEATRILDQANRKIKALLELAL